jgi:hypothetical protein
MRVGDFARAGTPNLSVIDEHSYWIDVYFEETKLANIHVAIRWRRRCWASKLRSAEGSRASRVASALRTRQAGPSKRRPDLHLGSTCATNSGAYQDRTSPSGGIARCRNDL